MSKGFTLVELLVVVTIIVILIAMLVPGLDKAQTQAKMAVCLSNLDTIATGAIMYAAGNKGLYPHRPTLRGGYWKRFNVIYDSAYGPIDDRPYLKDSIALDALVDPMGGEIDLDTTANNLFPNYELWFGAQFPGNSGLMRTSDRLGYTDTSVTPNRTYKLKLLASDEDKLLPTTATAYTHASHPDVLGRQGFQRQQDADYVISRYVSTTTPERGTIDSQHAFTDGSAHRYNDVKWNEWADGEQIVRVPIYEGNDNITYYSQVPRQ